MEAKDIVNIGLEHIHPHPDNPRKDLGDLTELAESIKKEWNPAELDGHSEGRRAGRVHCNHRSQKMRGSKAGRSGRGTLQNCGGNDS